MGVGFAVFHAGGSSGCKTFSDWKHSANGSTQTVVPVQPDARRHPRFAVAGRIQCEIQGPDIPVPLLNVSRGGFLVQSPLESRIGDVRHFRFIIEGTSHYIFVLRARVSHCAATTTNGNTTYLTGLEFIDTQSPVYQRAIEVLVNFAAQ